MTRHGRPAALVLVAVLVSLGGCALLADADEARVCRSVIPALNPPAATVKILTTQRLVPGHGVKMLYRVEDPSAEPRLRSLACSFDAARSGPAEPRHLVQVQTEEGVLGPARLHVLKRYWLEAIGVGVVDPEPIANAEHSPQIPRAAAVLLQHLIAAQPQMAVYALLATAYALVYGLIGRINLAFGDFALLGSYGALLGLLGGGTGGILLSVAAALVLAFWVAAMHGAVAARLVFAPIAHQRGQVVLIASTGLALFIAEYLRIAQGSGMRWTPPILNAPIGIARAGDFIVAITLMSVAVTVIALTTAACLIAVLHRSRFGRAWRACADDPFAAALMGLDPARLLLRTFVLASLIAGLGGAITTLYYGGVTHSGGLLIGLKALIAAILGGMGSVPGAFVGGLLLGAAEALWSAVFPIELRDPFIYAALAIALVIRPGGLGGSPDLEPRRN